MAEFVKIANMARRMCAASECVSCELNDRDHCMLDELHNRNDPEHIEQIIVAWGCKHKAENVWYPRIEDGEWYGYYDCGKCGKTVPELYDYCPGCGQKMEGEADAE